MKSIAFVICSVICCALTISAQPLLPSLVLVKMPGILCDGQGPTMKELRQVFRKGSVWGQDSNAIVKPWVVYSDRAENPTFMEPDLRSKRFDQLRYPVLSSPDDNGMVRCLCFLNNVKLTGVDDFNSDCLKNRLGEDSYNALKHISGSYFYDGYAKLDPWWKYVMLYSVDELRELLKELRPVHEAAVNQNPDRSQYVNAVRALLRSHTQGCVNDDDMNGWTPDVLEEKIYGIVNVKSENMRFTKFKLGDIISRQKVSDAEYFDILDRFDKKFKKLEKIPAGYDFRMDVGGMYYYWIPIEDLP